MKKKLAYIAFVRMPTEKAHGIQIMKMCEAFSLHELDVELVIPKRKKLIKVSVFVYYSVKKLFRVTQLPVVDLISRSKKFGKISYILTFLQFIFLAKIHIFFKKSNYIYTRDEWVGFFLKNYFLELHRISENVRFFHKRAWKKAKKIFVLTQLMKEDLIKYGVDGRKIHVSPDGVDLEQFTISLSKEDARKKLNLPYDKTIVMYTGSFYMYKWKGVDVLLEAAKRIDEDRYLFVLVGANKDEVSQIKRKYSLTNVLLLPHQPHKDIPVFLKAADVLVLPNTDSDAISSRYTSPLKLFEYMASGVPILASNIPSIREVLDNSNAVLFEPGSSKALVSGLKTLISDGELVSGLVKQAKEDVLEYTWHKRAGLVFLEVVT